MSSASRALADAVGRGAPQPEIAELREQVHQLTESSEAHLTVLNREVARMQGDKRTPEGGA